MAMFICGTNSNKICLDRHLPMMRKLPKVDSIWSTTGHSVALSVIGEVVSNRKNRRVAIMVALTVTPQRARLDLQLRQ